MDVITVAKKMNHRINALEKCRGAIKEGIMTIDSLAKDKATTSAEYEKQLAITIIRLRNGEEFELEGNKIDCPPVTIIEKIAKGICWQAKLNADKADALYKAHIEKMKSLQSELNGYQSVNRYLKDMPDD